MTVAADDQAIDQPRITGVHVTNYRALRSVDLNGLRPCTVLHGPNGSGKSTVVDLFAFLRECVTDGVQMACGRRGGLDNIRSRGAIGPVTVAISYRGGRPDNHLPA